MATASRAKIMQPSASHGAGLGWTVTSLDEMTAHKIKFNEKQPVYVEEEVPLLVNRTGWRTVISLIHGEWV